MEIQQYVEGRAEAKLTYWKQTQKAVVRWMIFFAALIALSFYFDGLFLGFLFLALLSSALFLLYCYQRVELLTSIQGHKWTEKNT